LSVFLILAVSILLQIAYEPYATRIDNWLENVLLVFALLTYLVDILTGNGFNDTNEVRLIMGYLYDAVLVGCILLLARKHFSMFRNSVQQWFKDRRRKRKGEYELEEHDEPHYISLKHSTRLNLE